MCSLLDDDITLENQVRDRAADTPSGRLVSRGVGSLSDSELLTFFMHGATDDRIDKARLAISEAGSLSTLLRLDANRFCALVGFGKVAYSQLQASIEVARRLTHSQLTSKDVLSSPTLVREYLSQRLCGLEHEVFVGLFLDNRHRVIAYRELFTGTIDSAAVYPREIVKACLSLNSAAVIFAHPHPSGVAEPSDTDVRLTRKLVDALSLINVRVLDHLVIGQGEVTSMAERGLM